MVCYSGIVGVILKWFQSPLLLLISLFLSHSTCAELWFLHFLYLLSFFLDHISVSRDCSIYWHAYLFFIIMDYESGLLLGIVLLVITCWFLNLVTLLSWLVSNDFGTWSYQCLLSDFTPVFFFFFFLLLLLSLLSYLCRVFTIVYLKQTIFLGYLVLQLFCIYNLCYKSCYFTHEICFVILH